LHIDTVSPNAPPLGALLFAVKRYLTCLLHY